MSPEDTRGEGDCAFRDLKDFYSFVRKRVPEVEKGDFIIGLTRGRRVLDLGCIDHKLERVGAGGKCAWLHDRIREQATEVLGLDILEHEAEELRSRGYRIIVADAQDFKLGDTFDVIVAGDLIEHLSNIGGFLASVERHMHADSIFIATTPNPFYIGRFVTALMRNYVSVNRQHAVWIDPKVMYETVARTGLEIVGFTWLKTGYQDIGVTGLRGWLVRRIIALVSQWRPVMRGDYAVVLKKRAT